MPLEERDTTDPVRPAAQLIQREDRTPVVPDQRDLVERERREEPVEIRNVIGKPILQLRPT